MERSREGLSLPEEGKRANEGRPAMTMLSGLCGRCATSSPPLSSFPDICGIELK
jgi:hypothetical protein